MSTTGRNVAAAGLLGLAAAGPAAAHEPPHPLLPADQAAIYTQQSRAAIINTLVTQAKNGIVLDQTVWNHHFYTYDVRKLEDLHPSGAAAIDRVVRRYVSDGRPGVLHLFLQRAQEEKPPDEKAPPAAWRGKL